MSAREKELEARVKQLETQLVAMDQALSSTGTIASQSFTAPVLTTMELGFDEPWHPDAIEARLQVTRRNGQRDQLELIFHRFGPRHGRDSLRSPGLWRVVVMMNRVSL